MTQKIGFIGLGAMGAPMAANLHQSGYQVTVWDKVPDRMEPLYALGIGAAASAGEVAGLSDVTITMVLTSDDVEEVVLGTDGVAERMSPGDVVVDMSTIAPAVSRAIAGRVKDMGGDMLDAPVSGGPLGAEKATLSIMVGGDRDAFDRCLPIFQVLGSRATFCGGNGMGTTAKLANQIIGLGNLAALSEGLLFATRAGMDPATVLQAVGGEAASSSWMVENMGPLMAEGNFGIGPKISVVDKDMDLILGSAAEQGTPLFTTPMVGYICRTATRMGLGQEALPAYFKVLAGFGRGRSDTD